MISERRVFQVSHAGQAADGASAKWIIAEVDRMLYEHQKMMVAVMKRIEDGRPTERARKQKKAKEIQQKEDKRKDKAAKADAEYQDILARVADLIRKRGPMPKRRISDDYAGTVGVLQASHSKVRATLSRAIESGDLIELPGGVGIPEHNRRA